MQGVLKNRLQALPVFEAEFKTVSEPSKTEENNTSSSDGPTSNAGSIATNEDWPIPIPIPIVPKDLARSNVFASDMDKWKVNGLMTFKFETTTSKAVETSGSFISYAEKLGRDTESFRIRLAESEDKAVQKLNKRFVNKLLPDIKGGINDLISFGCGSIETWLNRLILMNNSTLQLR